MSSFQKWMYIDSGGKEQGPFEMEEMAAWWSAGFFDESDIVKPVLSPEDDAEDVFLPISQWNPSWILQSPKDRPVPITIGSAHQETKTATTNIDYTQWIYINKAGGEVGPFSIDIVSLWIANECFSPKVLVKPVNAPRFRPVSEWEHLVVNAGLQWFLQNPKTMNSEGPYAVEDLAQFVSSGVFPSTVKVRASEEESWKMYSDVFVDAWYYEDVDGDIQGPFEQSVVENWVLKGEISRKALLRRGKSTEKAILAIENLPEFEDCIRELERIERIRAYEEEEKAEQGPPLQLDGDFFYLDDEGKEQGPFSVKQIVSWMDAGYFSEDLKIRSELTEDYFPLRSVQSRLLKHQRLKGTRSIRWWFMDLQNNIHGSYTQEQMESLGKTGAIASDFTFAAEGTGNGKGKAGQFMASGPAQPFFQSICEQWEYLDEEDQKQGPFSTQQMRQWFARGMLPPSLRCRTIMEKEFQMISNRSKPAFTSFSLVPSQQLLSAEELEDPEAFRTSGTFNKKSGRFEAAGAMGPVWERQGKKADAAGRDLDAYYDVEGYHLKRNKRKR